MALLAVQAAEPSLQERGDALIKNVVEMMAHGGMGDAKAIVHHCGEAANDAKAILRQLPDSDPRRSQALTPLTNVIDYCERVTAIGVHAAPGQLLNPAIKARAVST